MHEKSSNITYMLYEVIISKTLTYKLCQQNQQMVQKYYLPNYLAHPLWTSKTSVDKKQYIRFS
jgi:hypothetical protein